MIKKILEKMGLEELVGTEFEEYIKVFNLKNNDHYFVSENEFFELIYLVEGKLKLTAISSDEVEYYHLLNETEFEGINFSLCDFKKIIDDRKLDLEVYALEDSIIANIPLKNIFELDFVKKDKLLKKIIIQIATINANKYKRNIYSFKKKDEEVFLRFLKNNINNSFTCNEISFKLNLNLRTIQKVVKTLKKNNILKSEKRKFCVINEAKLKSYIENNYKNITKKF